MKRSWLLILVSLLVLSPAVHATSFYQRPFPDSVSEAPIIVRGRAGSSVPQWARGPDGVKRIYTFTDFQVSEVLKGKIEEKTLTIKELGGEVGGVGLDVSGTARFEKGEEGVLFLSKSPIDATYLVYGMMMGKYGVERGEGGQEILTGPGLIEGFQSGESHVHPGGGGQDGTDPGKKWTVESLKSLIQSQAQAAPSSPTPQNSAVPSPVSGGSSPLPRSLDAARQTAPQLQPSWGGEESGESSIGRVLTARTLLALFGVLIFAAFLGRRLFRK